MSVEQCPCGSQKILKDCCLPLIEGKTNADSPEQLMRSRYTAFCLNNMAYVQATTDPQVRVEIDFRANAAWADESEFKNLEVLRSSQEGNKGLVEFKASFIKRADPSAALLIHHELSKFRKQAGVWYFRDGKVLSEV